MTREDAERICKAHGWPVRWTLAAQRQSQIYVPSEGEFIITHAVLEALDQQDREIKQLRAENAALRGWERTGSDT